MPEGGNITEYCDAGAPLYTQIMGTIIFFVVWPLIVLDTKWFPLGRPAAALCGGVFMVVFTIVTQTEVYEIMGRKGNLQAISLLVGMMLLSYYFDREGLLRLIGLWIFGKDPNRPFKFILWKVCILTAVMAAFITNDATCLVLSPLMIGQFVKQKRPKRELIPLCLGIATSANIGSAATVFGNPQNAFIASAAGVDLADFFTALLPAAIMGLGISMGMIHLIYFRVLFMKAKDEDESVEKQGEIEGDIALQSTHYTVPSTLADERASVALSYDQSHDPHLSSQIAREREIIFSTERLSTSDSINQMPKSRSRYSLRGTTPRAESDKPSTTKTHQVVPGSQSIPEIHVADEGGETIENGLKKYSAARHSGDAVRTKETSMDNKEPKPNDEAIEEEEMEVVEVRGLLERSIREKIFIGWLIGIFVLIVVLLAVPGPPTTTAEFNLGLVPLGAAILSMFVDTICNRKYAFDAMLKIDWTVVLMFMGLFVWLGGFQNTCIPDLLVDKLSPYMNLNTFHGVLLFALLVLICSNIFSNVPLVILIVDRISDLCGDEKCTTPVPALLLAWVATIAGNFTLIGSMANLIVAEKARTTANFRLTFLRYIKFGLISTIIVCFSCLPVVYFLGKVAG